jgi:hypothetical protein
MSSKQIEEYYRTQLLKREEMILHYQRKERIRLEKEEDLQKRKQEFELERAKHTINLIATPKQSTSHYVNTNRYRNQNPIQIAANERNQQLKMEAATRLNRFPNKFFIGENAKYNHYLLDHPEQKEFPYYLVDTEGEIRCHCPERPSAVYLNNNCHIKCAKK